MAELLDMYKEADKLKDEGKLDEAIAKLTEVLERDETHVLSHLALAVLYGRVGKHDDAIKHGNRVCELDGEDPFNFSALSVTYVRAFGASGDEQHKLKAEDAMARANMMQGH